MVSVIAKINLYSLVTYKFQEVIQHTIYLVKLLRVSTILITNLNVQIIKTTVKQKVCLMISAHISRDT